MEISWILNESFRAPHSRTRVSVTECGAFVSISYSLKKSTRPAAMHSPFSSTPLRSQAAEDL